MIVVSNHILEELLEVKKSDIVVRVNVAWVKTERSLRRILKALSAYDVFLDYPEGRTKPPKPTISLKSAISLLSDNPQVKYFAISNAENIGRIKALRASIPDHIVIVPKLESPFGVERMLPIMKAARTKIAMLDKEDVYTSVCADQTTYNRIVASARKQAKKAKKTLIELEGVVFREHKEPK
jgi:hypothetical protein